MQGTTAWGDLDVGSLQRGSEELEKKARKEKELKDHATFRAVETRMYNFKVPHIALQLFDTLYIYAHGQLMCSTVVCTIHLLWQIRTA
jgi:hypothetical protein